MKTMILTAIAATTLLAGICAQASPAYCCQQSAPFTGKNGALHGVNGVTFVPVGGAFGYYVIAPGSDAVDAFGLQDAPYHDSDSNGRTGVGSDAIALRFGADGRLVGYPAYIGQAQSESFYTSRLAVLPAQRTTLADVRALFQSHTIHVEKQGAQTLAYVEVPVYDPLASGD